MALLVVSKWHRADARPGGAAWGRAGVGDVGVVVRRDGVTAPWRVVWATSRDLDPRLRFSLCVGAVVALAAGASDGGLCVAALTGDRSGGGEGDRLHAWDVTRAGQ